MGDEKYIWLLRHPCAKGLTDEAIREIADAASLIEIGTDEYVHRAEDYLTCLYLVVQGRLKTLMIDIHGRELVQRFITRGSQFGALAAAQVEPVPINVVATEPSLLLSLEYEKAIAFGGKYPTFQLNLLQTIGNELAQTLFVDRIHSKPLAVGIIHQSPASRVLTRKLLSRLVELEGSACLLSDEPDWTPMKGVEFRLMYDGDQLISHDESRRLLKQWAHLGRIVIDASHQSESEWLTKVVGFTDGVFWCVGRDNYRDAIKPIEALKEKATSWRDKISLVWLLEEEEYVAPRAPELMDLVATDFKVSCSPPPVNAGNQLLNGVERIIHYLRGVRIGIALGGGGAKGMAHLGVLKTLEDNGIVVDMIAGTSAGAMTGTVYAAGMETDYSIQSFVHDLTPSWVFRMLPSGGHLYLLHKYRTGQFDPMLRKYLKNARIEQLPIPMHTVTVDLVSGDAVVRDTGDAVHGIIESINLPVLSIPICRPGQALVDGGLVNNIPADVLVKRGCNFVIAVSVTAKLQQEFANMRPTLKKLLDDARQHFKPSCEATRCRLSI